MLLFHRNSECGFCRSRILHRMFGDYDKMIQHFVDIILLLYWSLGLEWTAALNQDAIVATIATIQYWECHLEMEFPRSTPPLRPLDGVEQWLKDNQDPAFARHNVPNPLLFQRWEHLVDHASSLEFVHKDDHGVMTPGFRNVEPLSTAVLLVLLR